MIAQSLFFMGVKMVKKIKFNSINEIQRLQRLAVESNEDVGIHSLDGKIIVDAKSFIGLFTVNFDEPVNVVCESESFFKKLLKD